MFHLQKLDYNQIDKCYKTMSSNTFYLLVGDAILTNKPLSVVRMADGEKHFFNSCCIGKSTDMAPPPPGHGEEWMQMMGCQGITRKIMLQRLKAAMKCDYFAPSISGITFKGFNVYDEHYWKCFAPKIYVDNFFPNAWDEDMKIQLFKLAKHVIFIHRNTSTADAMQIRAKSFGVKVYYIKLTSWEEADAVAEKAAKIDAPLVLFSAGPASKYIGPYIAHHGRPKVTLDIGQAADRWTFLSLNKVTRNDVDKVKL